MSRSKERLLVRFGNALLASRGIEKEVTDADLQNFYDSREVPVEESFGSKAVGFSFNPSKQDDVSDCKELFAEAIDQMHNLRTNSTSPDQKRHASVAITEIEGAQMRAVKALTWKD